jgi:glyoxylase I family protein
VTTLTGVHHLALTVSDADTSAEFYSALLGLEEAFQIDDETVRLRVFAGDGFLFGVRHYKSHDKDRFSEFRTGMDHFAFGVADRDALAGFERKLAEMGAVYTPACDTPFGQVLVFRDPDGIQGEFFLPAT